MPPIEMEISSQPPCIPQSYPSLLLGKVVIHPKTKQDPRKPTLFLPPYKAQPPFLLSHPKSPLLSNSSLQKTTTLLAQVIYFQNIYHQLPTINHLQTTTQHYQRTNSTTTTTNITTTTTTTTATTTATTKNVLPLNPKIPLHILHLPPLRPLIATAHHHTNSNTTILPPHPLPPVLPLLLLIVINLERKRHALFLFFVFAIVRGR